MFGYPRMMKAARLWTAVLVGAVVVGAAGGCAARAPARPAVVVLEVKGASGDGWPSLRRRGASR